MKTLPLALALLLAGAAVLLAGPGTASAQANKSGSIDLDYKPRTPALQKVPPRKIEEDTTQALSEIDRQPTDQTLRDSQPNPTRPDLDRDATHRAQSRGLGP